jgi:hypothetical protein
MPRGCLQMLCLLSLFAAFATQAQTRAWIDRDHVALGETLTLNIESSVAGTASPDYAPLQQDFIVSANNSSRQVEIVNGRTSARMLFAVALQPRREGLLTIPALRIGTQTTQPISVTVAAAAPPARAGSPAFIEAEVDDQNPYVQQAVGYTLRLYYATPLVSGQLDQDTPDGASLQRVGSDLQYTREVGGRRYTVVERRFLLVPERSGPLAIPGARFAGRGTGGFFDDMFGDGSRELSANGAPRFVTVRPVPANAPQPWLPLRGLGLRYLATPQQARAGEAATVTIEASADGATAAQMPELQLPAIDGAQVFAEPAQTDETFDNGRPQAKVTRKFSIVPSRTGALRIPGPRIAWWDTRAATARTASLPDVRIQVEAGPQGAGVASTSPGAAGADTTSAATASGMQAGERIWAIVAAAFALLWLATLVWALQRRAHPPTLQPAPPRTGQANPGASAGMRELRRALDTGDLGDVADTLCAMAQPPVADLDGVHARLDDAAQREAVEQLQRARWGGGDAPAARASLRAAFANGPRWRGTTVAATEPLPPLYPG